MTRHGMIQQRLPRDISSNIKLIIDDRFGNEFIVYTFCVIPNPSKCPVSTFSYLCAFTALMQPWKGSYYETLRRGRPYLCAVTRGVALVKLCSPVQWTLLKSSMWDLSHLIVGWITMSTKKILTIENISSVDVVTDIMKDWIYLKHFVSSQN